MRLSTSKIRQAVARPPWANRCPSSRPNATYAVRGRLVDGLRSAEHLDAWFRDNRARFAGPRADADLLGVGPEELRATPALRDAIREPPSVAVRDGCGPRLVGGSAAGCRVRSVRGRRCLRRRRRPARSGSPAG